MEKYQRYFNNMIFSILEKTSMLCYFSNNNKYVVISRLKNIAMSSLRISTKRICTLHCMDEMHLKILDSHCMSCTRPRKGSFR